MISKLIPFDAAANYRAGVAALLAAVPNLSQIIVVAPWQSHESWRSELTACSPSLLAKVQLIAPTEWVRREAELSKVDVVTVDDMQSDQLRGLMLSLRRVNAPVWLVMQRSALPEVVINDDGVDVDQSLVTAPVRVIGAAMSHADVLAILAHKTNVGPGVRRELLRRFDERGYSMHSSRGEMVGLFADHCRFNGHDFVLEAQFLEGKVVGMRIVRADAVFAEARVPGIDVRILYRSTHADTEKCAS